MALPPFKPPPLLPQSPIVDPKTGVPTQFYLDWINAFGNRTADAVNALNSATDALAAAINANTASVQATTNAAQAVAVAQAEADAASGSAAQSGDALLTVNVPAGGAWVSGPVVALAGVPAGNLSAINSGPRQIATTSMQSVGSFVGSYRIVEVIGGVDTVVFTGQFACDQYYEDTIPSSSFVSLYNTEDTSQFSAARVTTGAMEYRLDISSPDVALTDVSLYLYVRRS